MSLKIVRVVVDKRERSSGVADILKRLGAQVEFKVLDVGDYVVSSECAIERKHQNDFLRSLYSGRLFDQAQRLKEAYSHPILVVESGFPEFIYEMRNPRVFWGALATLALKFSLSVFFTADAEQTADLIYTIARQESVRKSKGPYLKKKPRALGLEQTQLLVVASLPGIGPTLADRILRRFGTLRRVFNASVAELASVDGVGRAKAERIISIVDAYYRPSAAKPQQLPLNET